MTEERDDIVVLVDENGEEEEFEYIDSMEMNGNNYVILSPLGKNDNADDDFEEVVVILKVDNKEDGEESFITIEDEKELDDVFEEFKSRMEEEFSFDLDEDDEDFDNGFYEEDDGDIDYEDEEEDDDDDI